jgi:hypothetical protein
MVDNDRRFVRSYVDRYTYINLILSDRQPREEGVEALRTQGSRAPGGNLVEFGERGTTERFRPSSKRCLDCTALGRT